MTGIVRITRSPDLKALSRRCKILLARELRGDANAYDLSEISALRRVIGELLPSVEERLGGAIKGREQIAEVLDTEAAYAYGNPIPTANGHWLSVCDDDQSTEHAWFDVGPSKRHRDDADGTRAVRVDVQQAIAIRNVLDSFISDRQPSNKG
ncbi:hypothetical protein BKG86_17020 [Mycobacteroides chelonae]|uniref:hypothetical protein n=1 Tax=Mycobacteroides chelonae TaxID=1774 RepID=UPI0008A9930A|nr:hypothetical protein [Mycobacteroides chelonae]OHU71355.1 hypothetical protein BKG86_17020 [Mycobacteroides chelonae]